MALLIPESFRSKTKEAAVGIALGVLLGFLASTIGVFQVMSASDFTVIVFLSLLGGVAGAAGLNIWSAGMDLVGFAIVLTIVYSPIMTNVAPQWVRSDPLRWDCREFCV